MMEMFSDDDYGGGNDDDDHDDDGGNDDDDRVDDDELVMACMAFSKPSYKFTFTYALSKILLA